MNKRTYKKPEMSFVELRGADAVADVCWAFAKNGQPFYLDFDGPGYMEIKMNPSESGCDGGTIKEVLYYKDGAFDHKCMDTMDEHYQEVLKGVKASPGNGNSAEPFKGSPFSGTPDGSWS